MRLTFLGTGSALPTPRRRQSGLLLETDGTRLLIDCGAGVLHRLAATEVGYEGLDAVLLTHHHLDHVSDLLALLKARWLAGAGPLAVAGPPGTIELLDDLIDVHDYLDGRVALNATDLEPGSVSVAGIEATAMETTHSMRCFAYRIPGRGGDLVISGDTEADTELVAFAEGAAVFVHDCAFPDGLEVSNHPTPSQLAAVLAGHHCGTVVLTHLYPQTAGQLEAMAETVRERYDGAVRIATDRETIEV